MSKKNEKAAPSEPERTESIDEMEERQAAEQRASADAFAELMRVPEEPVAPPRTPAEVTFEQWAELKGHIKRLPKAGRPRAAYVMPGPDYRVVKVHTQWPANKVVSEDEYDAAVKDTYGQEIRER